MPTAPTERFHRYVFDERGVLDASIGMPYFG